MIPSRTLLLVALLVLGASACIRPPERQQELRVLVTARNMVERGDWLRPEFQNRPRYRKPPLAYWTAAAGFGLTGRITSAWAGRLFFVLAAVVGIGMFAHLAGETAAWMLLFSFGILFYAPLAETDFLQLAGIVLAVRAWRESRGMLCGLGMAAAGLAKGPGGVVIPLLIFLALLRTHRPPLRFWIPAMLLPLAAAGGWLSFLYLDPVSRAALRQELSDTFLHSAHANPLPYYVWTLPLLLLPAGLLVFRIRRQADPGRAEERRVAAAWFWVTFALLTLTVSKQRHYALLLLPPACWWLSLRLRPGALPPLKARIALAVSVLLIQLAVVIPGPEFRTSRFLDAARDQVLEADTLHVVGINSARFDFHLGRHVENTDSVRAALARAAPGDAVLVVGKSGQFDLPDTAPVLEADHATWIRRLYLRSNPH